jgi:hypothetical protein
MRLFTISTMFLLAVLVSACDFWPRDLEALAESIGQQTSGEATAWLVGGDVLLITVTGSPLFRAEPSELEAQASGIAEQAMASAPALLESIVITFYEHGVTDAEDTAREFIFVVIDGRPALQPHLDVDATGPLTPAEFDAVMQRLGDTLPDDQKACVREEVEKRAQAAGDPELLDPANVEFLTAETWNGLDAFGRRLLLTQALTTEALFACVRPGGG